MCNALDGARFDTSNPYTGKPWASVPDAGADDVELAVRAATAAMDGEWGRCTGFERARHMRRLADVLERDAADLAVLESRDNGKLLRETSAQTAALPSGCATSRASPTSSRAKSSRHRTRTFSSTRGMSRVGVVAAIVPWNSPLSLLMWKFAPLLAAGCTLVVKPSDYTPVTALELARRVEESGLPAGVLNVVTGRAQVGEALVANPGVQQIAFTGSTGVGVKVAQSAAAHLARTTVELGGKSAQVVFDDADIEATVNGVIAGIFAASGRPAPPGRAWSSTRTSTTSSWTGWRRGRRPSRWVTRSTRPPRWGPSQTRRSYRPSRGWWTAPSPTAPAERLADPVTPNAARCSFARRSSPGSARTWRSPTRRSSGRC